MTPDPKSPIAVEPKCVFVLLFFLRSVHPTHLATATAGSLVAPAIHPYNRVFLHIEFEHPTKSQIIPAARGHRMHRRSFDRPVPLLLSSRIIPLVTKLAAMIIAGD